MYRYEQQSSLLSKRVRITVEDDALRIHRGDSEPEEVIRLEDVVRLHLELHGVCKIVLAGGRTVRVLRRSNTFDPVGERYAGEYSEFLVALHQALAHVRRQREYLAGNRLQPLVAFLICLIALSVPAVALIMVRDGRMSTAEWLLYSIAAACLLWVGVVTAREGGMKAYSPDSIPPKYRS